ncbi:hypothetical protein [Flammeovirga pacifica]|uniref:GyrI-like small molecule binding domain-containing protein n=1 Tax=Flammeovirga pacifica TaxID=915059 RepID=A0A1S1Z4H6_FLAPC|nr:hypothetical protein [Flammeovirga pacifica]OHX68141.1 hypothetical protein NH26_18215 [Flammeovirga pacifica]
MANNKWVFILFGFISLGIIAVLSGAFVDIEIEQRKHEGFTIKGFAYEGDITKEAFTHLYDSVIQQKNKGVLKGDMAVLFYTHPSEHQKANVIVGVINDKQNNDEKFTVYHQKAYEEIYSIINLGEMFTPNPDNVIDAIDQLKEEKNLKGTKYLEYYTSPTEVIQSVIID